MVDNTENPTTRSNGEPQERAQYDDHGQRHENQGNREQGDDSVREGSERHTSEDEYAKILQKVYARNPEATKWSPEFNRDWINYFSGRIKDENAGIINGIYSVDAFEEFVSKLRKKTTQEFLRQTGFTQDQINGDPKKKERLEVQTSENIEEKIVLAIVDLYYAVDFANPNETFSEIEQSNFMRSIRTSRDMLLERLGNLRQELGRRDRSGDLPAELKKVTFYKKYSETEDIPRMIKRDDGTDKIEFHRRPIPIARNTDTSIDDFIQRVYAQTNNYLNTRRYLHDITVLFKRGPGQEGFWSQVAEYAKQISTTDIDNMMLLPDSKVFMTAHDLYIKHLTQVFGKLNWTHDPSLFSADFFAVNTDVENNVLDDLKKLFPDIFRENPDKLQRALKMGVGMARGVTLAEVEIAASADPPYVINSEGKREVSFESLYISDAAPLSAFRPTYGAERFLPRDMTEGPLLYAPVSNFKKRRFWNHNELWERMKEYEKSYVEGRRAIDIKDETELLIDAAANFGKIGAIDFRSGWRFPRGYDAWLRRVEDSDGVNRGKLDYLESWKQLENIGFVSLKNFIATFINSDHEPDGKKFLLNQRNRPGEREAFFQYLYEKYINYNPVTRGEYTSASLSDEVSRIQTDLRKQNPKITSEDLDEKTYRLLLSKALFGALRQRIPTYFIRLDRDRTSRDGESAYKLLLKSTGWDHINLDKTLNNLGIVEMKLRLKVSSEMKAYLSGHDKDLADPSIKYVLSEEFIRDALRDMGNSAEEISDAVELFTLINRDFLSENNKFAQDRIRMLNKDKFKFTIGMEELDRYFLGYRAAGESVFHRTIKDNSLIEEEVSKKFQEHIMLLRKVATDPNKDISKLIENLSKIRKNIAILHGDPFAWEQTSKLVISTIDYFRKDYVGRLFWGLGGIGRKNSLAAENEGTWRGIWEWGNEDIDRFIIECERERILPKYARDLKLTPEVEEKSFLGFKYKVVTHKIDDKILTGHKVREMAGATRGDITRGILLKLGPLILGLVLFNAIKKALEEEKKR